MLAHVAKHVRGLCIQLSNQFFVILQSTKGIFGVMLWNKKFLTTFGRTSSTEGGLSTTSQSPNVNANTMHASVAVNCTLQLRNSTHISEGHKTEACTAN